MTDLGWASVTPKRHTHDWASALCPNCVTPWKCNGPHLIEEVRCSCGKVWSEAHAASRRGRNNRKRGQTYEREWARRLHMRQEDGEDSTSDPYTAAQPIGGLTP